MARYFDVAVANSDGQHVEWLIVDSDSDVIIARTNDRTNASVIVSALNAQA